MHENLAARKHISFQYWSVGTCVLSGRMKRDTGLGSRYSEMVYREIWLKGGEGLLSWGKQRTEYGVRESRVPSWVTRKPGRPWIYKATKNFAM